jgi:hypothetical protein
MKFSAHIIYRAQHQGIQQAEDHRIRPDARRRRYRGHNSEPSLCLSNSDVEFRLKEQQSALNFLYPQWRSDSRKNRCLHSIVRARGK